MKITTFNPQIIAREPEAVAGLFEQLGFERRHHPSGIGELNVEGIRMKDANGFYLDISHPESTPANEALSHDICVIRMNVDDFEEAYAMLTARGFRNIYGDHTAETRSSRSALLISPSGFAINLIQHIKDHD